MGPCEVKIFDTKDIAEKNFGRQSEDCTKGLRPIRAIDLLDDWLVNKDTFPYESHGVHVLDRLLKRPLFFRRKKE